MDLGCPSERSNRKSAPALLATPSHRPWTTGPSPGREIARARTAASVLDCCCHFLAKAATTLFCISQPPLHPLWSLSPPHSPWWGNEENNATKWWSGGGKGVKCGRSLPLVEYYSVGSKTPTPRPAASAAQFATKSSKPPAPGRLGGKKTENDDEITDLCF